METSYKSKKLEKICMDFSAARKAYGIKMAEKIHMRIDQISAVETVEVMIQFRIGRCHRLEGDRKHQYAVDLVQPFRLIFEKHGDEIQIAKIIEIEDYH